MSPAVRDLETLILERKLRHGAGHPVLTMCIANSVIERGDAGNRKLSKKRSTGRIDGAVALVMAIGRSAGSGIRQRSTFRPSSAEAQAKGRSL